MKGKHSFYLVIKLTVLFYLVIKLTVSFYLVIKLTVLFYLVIKLTVLFYLVIKLTVSFYLVIKLTVSKFADNYSIFVVLKRGIAKQRKELPFASFRERNIMPMKGRLFSMKEAFFLQKEGAFGKLTSNFRYV